jgi:hypothetical protein
MPATDKPRFGQVNIRLSPDEARILQAIALLEQRTGAEVLKPVVVRYLRRRAAERDIADITEVLTRRRIAELAAE